MNNSKEESLSENLGEAQKELSQLLDKQFHDLNKLKEKIRVVTERAKSTQTVNTTL